MGKLENQWLASVSRRHALLGLAGMFAGSSALRAQRDPQPLRDHRRMPGLDEMLTAFDFEPIFRANVTRLVYDTTAHGAGTEFTMRRNREAFEWVDVVPRAGADVNSISTATDILGMKMDVPIFVAPSSGQGALHPDGESAMHVGATAANTTMIVASGSSVPLEKIAAAADRPLWYQHYPVAEMGARRLVLEKAQGLGCRAVVVTVDGRSVVFERDQHDRHLGGNTRQGARRAPAAATNPYRVTDLYAGTWIGWNYLDEIRPFIKVPMVIKGIISPEDAVLAVEHGADGIVVSNHGGRILDYDPATLEVLPEIIDAVGGRIPVLIDSGFRRGSDVFKALALGARGVLLGRAARWGLGAFGPAGVQRLLEIVQSELVATMKSAGRLTVSSIDRSAVRTRFT
jgi:4-hydroxymandelate oxidase